MPTNYENLRRMWDTRWTPLTTEFSENVQRVVDEAGGITMLAEIIGLKARHIRRLVRGHGKAVSFRVADTIFSRSSRATYLLSLPWYTIEEIQEMKIWNPPFGNYIRDIPNLDTVE